MINEQQREIIESEEKKIVVLACPGSGKTMTIINKVLNICKNGTPLNRVLMVTFTRKAAGEMKDRLAEEIKIPRECSNNICTLHSLGCRILNKYNDIVGLCDDFEIALQSEKSEIAKMVLYEKERENDIVSNGSIEDFLSYVSCRKNGFIHSGTGKFNDEQFAKYNQFLIDNGLIDIDDYIYLTVRILKESISARKEVQSRFSYIFVDEYQDINKIQNEFLDLIMTDDTHVMYVGDDDQSIYEFRGANPNYIREKSEDGSGYKVYMLGYNYRSEEPIVDLSKKVLSDMLTPGRRDKKIIPVKKKSRIKPVRKEFFSVDCEVDYVVNEIERLIAETDILPSEIAVLSRYKSKENDNYKSHPELRKIAERLELRGIHTVKVSSGMDAGAADAIRQSVQALSAFISKSFRPAHCNAFVPNSYNEKKFQSLLVSINNQYGENIGLDNFRDAMNQILKLKPQLENKGDNKRLSRLADAYTFYEKQRGNYLIGKPLSTLFLEYMEFVSDRKGEEEYKRYKDIYLSAYKFLRSNELHVERKERVDSDTELVKLTAEYLSRYQEELGEQSVRLLTAHQSKGLQFDAVFVVGLQRGNFPNLHDACDDNDLDNERRLFYVCITRARELLYLLSSLPAAEDGVSFVEGSDDLYSQGVVSFNGIEFTKHTAKDKKEVRENREILQDFESAPDSNSEEEKNLYIKYSMPEIPGLIAPEVKELIEKEWKVIYSHLEYTEFHPAVKQGITHFVELIDASNRYLEGQISESVYKSTINSFNYKGGFTNMIVNILQYFALRETDGPIMVVRFINAYLGRPDPTGKEGNYYERVVQKFKSNCQIQLDEKLLSDMSTMYSLATCCNHSPNSNSYEYSSEIIRYYRNETEKFFKDISINCCMEVFSSYFKFIELFLNDDKILTFAAKRM